MASIPQRVLVAIAGMQLSWMAAAGAESISSLPPHKLHADDPVWKEPQPRWVTGAKTRSIDPLFDFVENSIPGQAARNRAMQDERLARGINTLGEVPDSAWYTNRHARHRMSREELIRGPGNSEPPQQDRPWRVTGAKSDGVTPGFLIEDAEGRQFLLKFDPPRHPGLASAADVIGSKIFYALGYWTPENYIVHFDRQQLSIDPQATYTDASGHKRALTDRRVNELLAAQPHDAGRGYRALASRIIPGKVLGPFRYKGTRADDPNDVIPHEDRRDLRGLAVLAAWLNHTDAKSINTLDTLVNEEGSRYVRHYLIDFGAALGSDSFAPKDARLGHEYFVDLKPTAVQIATLGFYAPKWARARYPRFASVGHFSAEGFTPEKWKPNYPNPAFARLQLEDAFWAAKLVMSFTDEDLAALVSTGEYEDPAAAAYVLRTLIERRDAIGNSYLRWSLPLDRFAVSDGQLVFTDLLGEGYFSTLRSYAVTWALYDNARNQVMPIASEDGFELPAQVKSLEPGEYASATVRYVQTAITERNATVTVYLRRETAGWAVAGIDRKQ